MCVKPIIIFVLDVLRNKKCVLSVDRIVGRDSAEVEEEQKMLEEAIKNARERDRRTLLRANCANILPCEVFLVSLQICNLLFGKECSQELGYILEGVEWYLRFGFPTSLLSDREQEGLSRAATAAVRLVSSRVVVMVVSNLENRNANFDYRNANLDYRNAIVEVRIAIVEFGKSQRELRLSQCELGLSQCEYVNHNAIVEVRVANLETDLRYRRSRCELSIALRFSWFDGFFITITGDGFGPGKGWLFARGGLRRGSSVGKAAGGGTWQKWHRVAILEALEGGGWGVVVQKLGFKNPSCIMLDGLRTVGSLRSNGCDAEAARVLR
ncbi:hypothetical protein F3Y22_tig00112507pilonHSYRG00068 [Hibiscus syriacus]|uniref:Uncharacterized protein n=1 Tax=Hibiscus syriacus TaxID=106335 RepID=A0A6A2Y8J3_HIBSY|nr:hypothetical protein F3Y22_tig00112507pilonHSYRG00068 [Hibiscus syriacus]